MCASIIFQSVKYQPWKFFFKIFKTWYYVDVTALNDVISERWTSKMQQI